MNYNEYGKKSIEDRLSKFGLNDKIFYPEISLSEMSVEQLRWYATFISNYAYERIFSNVKIDREKEKEIVSNLNNEFNNRFSFLVPIYDLLDKINNTEKWHGDLRYKLLSYTFKGYEEVNCFRKAIEIFKKLTELKVSVKSFVDIMETYNSYVFWDKYPSNEEQKNIDEKNELIDKLLKRELI